MNAPDPFALARLDDAELIEAERELASLRKQRAALPATSDADYEALSDQIWATYKTISRTAPSTMEGAAVKLRLMLDPDLGLDLEYSHDDFLSVRQIAELVEREVQR